jgi:MOSC domain-containing protein
MIVVKGNSGTWIGKKVTGEDAVLKITGPCTRSVMTTLPQGDLPRDLGILRTTARYNQVHAGVYAAVHKGVTIRRGHLGHLGSNDRR